MPLPFSLESRMEPSYILFNIALGGFVTSTGQYTPKLERAQHFPQTEAMRRVSASRDHDGNLNLLPIAWDDVKDFV